MFPLTLIFPLMLICVPHIFVILAVTILAVFHFLSLVPNWVVPVTAGAKIPFENTVILPTLKSVK